MNPLFHRLCCLGLLVFSASAASAHPNHAFEREGLAHQLLSPDHWLAGVLVLLWLAMGVAWALSMFAGVRKAAVD